MRLDEPGWWYERPPNLIARLLRPASRLYWRLAQRTYRSITPVRSGLPVICIGNFTAGGTGKTPLAIEIARRLVAMGERPAFLTRGYGGAERGPLWVAPSRHTAAVIGDEPLLLARTAPTMVARNRAAGARAIASGEPGARPTVIIMDDGLQNPSLAKDLSLAVVDARRGVGNGETLPGGPLRAPLDEQLAKVDAVIVNEPPGFDGNSEQSAAGWLRQRFTGPVLVVHPVPDGDLAQIEGAPVIAFAGIANPDRFFHTVAALGARLAESIPFPDHHAFTERDALRLLDLAATHGASLVTTEKDLARLSRQDGYLAELARRSHPIAIRLELDDRDGTRLDALIDAALKRRRSRAD